MPPPSDIDARLAGVLRRLLAESAADGSLTLDAIGDAIGDTPVSYDEVDQLFQRLEAAGRSIRQPPGTLTVDLGRVIAAARALKAKLGRSPRIDELAAETGLSEAAVITALRFAQTFG